jgi:Na+/H+-dicarboxylate symporter
MLPLYILTTGIAITLALVVAITIAPGKDFTHQQQTTEFIAKPSPPITDVFINIIPGNPVEAFAEGNMLQIIFFVIQENVPIACSNKQRITTEK